MQTFDALIAEAILALIVAPLAGLAVAAWRRLVAGIAVGMAVSIVAYWAAAGAAAEALRPVLVVHVTLGAAAVALVSLGAFFRALFTNVLDAAACALATAALGGFGIFVAGPAVIDLPTPILNLALLANPLVAIASAANVDLFRGELLYHLSPIAHRSFDYPAWHASAGLYAACAALLLAARAARVRWGRPVADYRRFCL